LNLSEEAEQRIVNDTGAFSYAYLKEFFVSSVMQWMANQGAEDLVSVLTTRIAALRKEMRSGKAAE